MIGDQPPGMMQWRRMAFTCDGQPAGTPTWEIKYSFWAGVWPATGVHFQSDSRKAYLPDTEEGREVLALFVKCFKRRLMLTVGFSVTRQLGNCVIWNGVHHKSRKSGGACKYGYPDDTYFMRVKQELKLKGVSFESEEAKEAEIDEITQLTNGVQVGVPP